VDEAFAQPFGDQQEERGTDVASWNDFGPVACAARAVLTKAAAIEIPDRAFVVWVIGGYLVVLVPLNWLVFRMMGRVELAWVAAPVVALLWTALVIHLARLDIGFARSQTEIDVVELQGDYPRAHVTRYLALYTSLSTSYRLESEDPGALMLPFPETDKPRSLPSGGRRLTLHYGKDAGLHGMAVESNSTGFVHGEQMLDMGGAIRLTGGAGGALQVVNGTGLALHGARVVRKNGEAVQSAWIGTLAPGQAAALEYTTESDPAARATGRPNPAHGEGLPEQLDLGALVAQAESAQDLRAGEQRLVAWSMDALPGMTVNPLAPQIERASLIVAHLEYGFGPDPRPDANTWEGMNPPKVFTPREAEPDRQAAWEARRAERSM
jgi:hypothetical protein